MRWPSGVPAFGWILAVIVLVIVIFALPPLRVVNIETDILLGLIGLLAIARLVP